MTLSARSTSGRAAGNPDLARHTDDRVRGELLALAILDDASALGLEPRKGCDVEALPRVDRPARIRDRDEDGTFCREKPRGMAADRAEALHGDARALELDARLRARRLDGDGEAEAGGADLIERDAA